MRTIYILYYIHRYLLWKNTLQNTATNVGQPLIASKMCYFALEKELFLKK